jgi:hypothetical protein
MNKITVKQLKQIKDSLRTLNWEYTARRLLNNAAWANYQDESASARAAYYDNMQKVWENHEKLVADLKGNLEQSSVNALKNYEASTPFALRFEEDPNSPEYIKYKSESNNAWVDFYKQEAFEYENFTQVINNIEKEYESKVAPIFLRLYNIQNGA